MRFFISNVRSIRVEVKGSSWEDEWEFLLGHVPAKSRLRLWRWSLKDFSRCHARIVSL
jgi:hypothetical protein